MSSYYYITLGIITFNHRFLNHSIALLLCRQDQGTELSLDLSGNTTLHNKLINHLTISRFTISKLI